MMIENYMGISVLLAAVSVFTKSYILIGLFMSLFLAFFILSFKEDLINYRKEERNEI